MILFIVIICLKLFDTKRKLFLYDLTGFKAEPFLIMQLSL